MNLNQWMLVFSICNHLAEVDVKLCGVLVEGGRDALALAYNNIKRNIPLVVINNSGRVSDVICFAYMNTEPKEIGINEEESDHTGSEQRKRLDISLISDYYPLHLYFGINFEFLQVLRFFCRNLFEKLMEMLNKILATSWQKDLTAKDVEIWYNQIMEMIEMRNLISIYDAGVGRIDGGDYLDSAILKGLFKATSSERDKDQGLSELKLALSWNRVDLVKEALFIGSSECNKSVGLSSAHFAYLMPYTLEHDRIEFVRDFMAHGLEIGKFLSTKILLVLYNLHVCKVQDILNSKLSL